MGDESGQFTQRLLSSLAGDCIPPMSVRVWLDTEREDRQTLKQTTTKREKDRERETERDREKDTEIW